MFRLYYFYNQNTSALIYSNEDLQQCFKYMQNNHYQPSQCTIISPNNRKITFTNNRFIVDGVCYSNKLFI